MQDPVVEPVETTICNRLRVCRLRLFAEAYSSVSLDFDSLNRRLDDNFKNSNFDLLNYFVKKLIFLTENSIGNLRARLPVEFFLTGRISSFNQKFTKI